MLLIDAIYIHNGGGKVLLIQLIKRLEKLNVETTLLLDSRLELDFDLNFFKVSRLNPSILQRHKFYYKYQKIFNTIFCFANIPPSVKCNAKVFTFFQNVLLIEPIKPSISLFLKKVYLKIFQKNTNAWIVQTLHVSNLLKNKICTKSQVFILPFFNTQYTGVTVNDEFFQDGNDLKFLYVSSGAIHKNHYNLLRAFKNFNKLYPKSSLTLTISENYTDLINQINDLRNSNVNIVNKGFSSTIQLQTEYLKANIAIFPSLCESFGLGLIEATFYNLKIIGADLPYLHELVKADLVFDPSNSDDIFRSMCEMINHKEQISNRLKINNNIDSVIELLNNQ